MAVGFFNIEDKCTEITFASLQISAYCFLPSAHLTQCIHYDQCRTFARPAGKKTLRY